MTTLAVAPLTTAGETAIWSKHPDNPVIGPGYCIQAIFDCCVLPEGEASRATGGTGFVVPEGERLRMWQSWRDMGSISYAESDDGVRWSPPRIVLEVDPHLEWARERINRPHVIKVGDAWLMWYTGQRDGSALGLATSSDGEHWLRVADEPVLAPCGGWEKQNIMCPHVLHEHGVYRLWYSAGERYEPDAIGYAESGDGVHWQRHDANPVLRPAGGWESDRVTAACILRRKHDHLAFYIGFGNGFSDACIGLARSKDGIHDWERYPGNPIIRPGPAGSWDDRNVYKPYVLWYRGQWYLWYNAARESDRREQIGLATCPRIDF